MLHTSLSHSADMIAAAVSTGRPVGVDIRAAVALDGAAPFAIEAATYGAGDGSGCSTSARPLIGGHRR